MRASVLWPLCRARQAVRRFDKEALRLLGPKEPEPEELKAQRFDDTPCRGEGRCLLPREETDLPGGVEGAWGGTRVEVRPGFHLGDGDLRPHFPWDSGGRLSTVQMERGGPSEPPVSP